MQFTYTLSPEALAKEYSITGIRPAASQNFSVEDLTSTPEIRALYELMSSSEYPPLGEADRRFEGWDHLSPRQHSGYAFLGEADRYLTEEDVLPYLQRSKDQDDIRRALFKVDAAAAATEMEQWLEMIESGTLDEEFTIANWNKCVQTVGRFATAVDRFLSVQILVKALVEAKTIRRKAEGEAERAAAAASREILRQEAEAAVLAARIKDEEFEEAKRLWIKDHGDDRLKRAVALGHPCEEGYLTQRASQEYPDFTLDYYNQSPWFAPSYPSVKAMDMLEKLPEGFEIVSMTTSTRDEGYREFEAIMLRAYMGTRATLHREVSQS